MRKEAQGSTAYSEEYNQVSSLCGSGAHSFLQLCCSRPCESSDRMEPVCIVLTKSK